MLLRLELRTECAGSIVAVEGVGVDGMRKGDGRPPGKKWDESLELRGVWCVGSVTRTDDARERPGDDGELVG